jgi:hypothetical protein
MHLIYDYYGLVVYFKEYPELPIKVYASRDDAESSMSITFKNGLVDDIHFLQVNKELDHEDREVFRLILERNISEIIKAWLDIFLYNKSVEPEIIKTNIKSQQ